VTSSGMAVARVTVTRAINLDYLDPAEVDPGAWAADPGTLVVPDAGEDLYRLREPGRR
jgi:hypothetical protein